jgi:hypothetical protein
MKTVWLGLLALGMAVIAAGCGRYAGAIFGGQTVPGSTLQNCYDFQFDTYEGTYNESKRRPLFAIVWQAHCVGSSRSDGRNMLVSIHEHSVAPSRTKKAVYALQPDYLLNNYPSPTRKSIIYSPSSAPTTKVNIHCGRTQFGSRGYSPISRPLNRPRNERPLPRALPGTPAAES